MPDVLRAPAPSEQIAAHFREEIRSGQLRSGDALPANRHLAETWGVAQATSHKAITILREEGWIVTRPGKPPVVSDDPPA